MSKKQNKRNTKKFRKSQKKKSNPNRNSYRKQVNPYNPPKVELDLPKIELGLCSTIHKKDKMDEHYDMMSDLLYSKIHNLWDKKGVSSFHNSTNNNREIRFIDNLEKYNSESFRFFGTKDKYYHLTSPKNYEKIKVEGIRSKNVQRMTSLGNEGFVWTVESSNPLIWNQVGYGQLGVGVINLPVVVLEIDPKGVTGELLSEEVGEYTSPLHTLIKQDLIKPEFIKPVGYFLTSRNHYYSIQQKLGDLKYNDSTQYLKMVS